MTIIVDGARSEQLDGVSNRSALAGSGVQSQSPVEDLTALAPDIAAWMTVVIPTRNEQDSIAPLLERIATTLGSVPAEILFVDDSTDETPEAIRACARTSGLAVRLLHRDPGENIGGLGGAVVAGLKHARGPWAVVMDADLQHPPELITKMVAIGQSRDVDLVAGTRYVDGGESQGLEGGYRRAVSSLATRSVKALFPRRLALLSDPMSGFFAIRLGALDLETLRPVGFKILLEIVIRQNRLRVAQVPFVFGERVAGESKASVREGARFLRHVSRLRLKVLRGQLAKSSTTSTRVRVLRLILFGLVGLTGLAVNEAVLWLMLNNSAQHYLLGAIVATEASTLWNFALTETLVFRGPKPGSRPGRFVRFALVNHAALLLRLPLLALLVETVGTGVLLGNLITLSLLFLVRFLVADAAIYATPDVDRPIGVPVREPMRVIVHVPLGLEDAAPSTKPTTFVTAPPARPGTRYLPYRYSIGSLLTIGSQVPLPELEYFRAQWVGSKVDLAVRVGAVGRGTPRTRALMTHVASTHSLTYQEHLGRLGANFAVRVGETVEVTASPTLARSPHVLYTNVIEALLRFIAVSRGVVLLHSACLELDGSGMLLSARTDTGKTGTVLRMLRDYGALFLSDDMTLVDRDGTATCFPKPLTISHHTLQAIQAGDLTAAEWRRLKVQSRLHSAEGRQFGMLLAGLNIPIMGVNSLTQRVIPPPKFAVDRLVDCTIGTTTTVRDLFVVERGKPAVADIGFAETIETLIENTDDAYGFPPFRQLAPSIVIGDDDYAELRLKERALLISAMQGVRARRVASDNFTWCDSIAEMLRGSAESPAAAGPLPMDLGR